MDNGNYRPRNVVDFLANPQAGYIPYNALSFGPPQVVLPAPVPQGIGGVVFPTPQFNKMLNIPFMNAQGVYRFVRTGRAQA